MCCYDKFHITKLFNWHYEIRHKIWQNDTWHKKLSTLKVVLMVPCRLVNLPFHLPTKYRYLWWSEPNKGEGM
jgi:hypothetical protein